MNEVGAPRILLVEDDDICADLLSLQLVGRGYQVVRAEDGEVAWLKLQDADWDLILLDWELPRLDGIGVLARLNASPAPQSTPVVMLTSRSSPADIQQALQAGAFYFLTKPHETDLLLAIVEAAIQSARARDTASRAGAAPDPCLGMLADATFAFRSPKEARLLAEAIAGFGTNPNHLFLGVYELALNAVEHGNLALSYADKTRLLQAGRWHDTLEARLLDPVLGLRQAQLRLQRSPQVLIVTISDEGAGFDWRPYLDLSAARVFDPNGRGIAMARKRSFDTLEYQGSGNTVIATLHLGTGISKGPSPGPRRGTSTS